MVSLYRDVALIPSLAIHMDHGVNNGFAPNRRIDLCPVVSAGALEKEALQPLLANELDLHPDQIVSHDLYLVNRQAPCIWGAAGGIHLSPQHSMTLCAPTLRLKRFCEAPNDSCVSVYCCFDNEEVGSNTKQGAMSTFLPEYADALEWGFGWFRTRNIAAHWRVPYW